MKGCWRNDLKKENRQEEINTANPALHIPHAGDFYKVSFNQFYEAMRDGCYIATPDSETIREIYDAITIPVQATRGSAGFDFVVPFDITLFPGDSIKIPTGIRAKIKPGWFLACVPRSSLGFKYRVQLDNTVGIIDSDYYFATNEGHIFAKLTNDSKTGAVLKIGKGDRFMQGIFIPYGVTGDSPMSETRTGGMGSTGM
ncbi:MAG: deoxyuridine 5'-triphosphate nucleotidohydrolase [bacterium]|nr:deoxyuridine 5'-triphosphate nucleotidohydrolase [bacterium]